MGFEGKLLEVDLTKKKIARTPLEEAESKNFIGGRGLAAKLLWDRTPVGMDPFSAENPLMFLLGPITGVFGGGQTCVGFKSPETLTIGHAITGGYFGAALKAAGYDGLIITGKAEAPVYLFVDNDEVSIKGAEHLWGKGVTETEIRIREELGDPEVRILCCGPAGENLVRTTAIIQGSWRAAARGGGGAVMGSKKLKAVAVRGSKGIFMQDPEVCFQFIDMFMERRDAIMAQYYNRKRYGTTISVLRNADVGLAAVKNFREGDWAEIDKTGGVRLERRNVVGHASCDLCPGGCFQVGVVRKGPYAGSVSQIDFDSSALIGPSCLVTDLDGLQYLNALSDELGFDTEGLGSIIAWAMECYEKGILTKQDLGGLDLTWGNVPAMVELMGKMVRREGIGDLLAEGLRYAPQKVGQGSERFAMHCKGMGFGGYQPFAERGLQYAVGDRGGCHHFGTDRDEQNWRCWSDSLTCCAWHRVLGREYTKLLKATTGWEIAQSREEFDLIAERMLIMARAYNIREGMVPLRDDVLPERTHSEPLTYGRGKGKTYPKEKFLQDRAAWYRMRGCDERGIPTREHLEELGLALAIPELEKQGVYA